MSEYEVTWSMYGTARVEALDKAEAAAGDELSSQLLGVKLTRLNNKTRAAITADAQRILAAAYPHVFAAVMEALRARAEAEFSGPEYDDADVSYPNPAHWLARIAQEPQP